MLKKKATGGAAASEPATPSKLARRGNGGSPPSLLLSTRSLPGLFSRDVPISPTSMGEQSKTTPSFVPRNGSSGPSHCGGIGSQAAGLAAVLVAGEADGGHIKKGRVLLGMRLRVQLPQAPPDKSPGDLPGSPIEFGVKNRDTQLALLSPVQRSPLSSAARAARRSEEDELAEDYTCVIARGPNPKMTHIFEDRVVESLAGAGDGDARCLLSSCCGCEEDDLLLQRGEKAFNSSQCNDQETLFGKRIRDTTDTSVELKP